MTRQSRLPVRGPRIIVLALLAAASLAPAPLRAASKITIAAIGDPVPGGGLFAGPGFTGWPSAAGDGWIAFRGLVAAGTTSEQIVVAHMIAPVTRAAVASIAGTAPDGAGTFKQFLGQPTVNAHGDVAFLALLAPPAGSPVLNDPTAPTPAGVYVYRSANHKLFTVALSGLGTADGPLDLAGIVDPLADPNSANDVAERSPALNDAGDVAFLSAFGVTSNVTGALFLAPAGGGLVRIARTGDAYDSGQFTSFGPPALNAHRTLAFHGTASTSDPSDDDGVLDGIFTADVSGVTLVVRDGMQKPMPLDQPLSEFQDPVALNDAGDIVFLGGPLFDPSPNADPNSDGEPGVVVYHGGVVSLIGYPSQLVGPDRVTGIKLGSSGANALAPPALAPDGSIVFFVSLNGGNGEAILRWTGGTTVQVVVYTGGISADATPAGGVYSASESPPAVDATGGVVFFARIAGGTTSEVVVYRPAGGATLGIVVGDATPSEGFFAGQPFSAPLLNDRGDVVFHAYVARGPTSSAIFRARDGHIQALVRTGDPSPTPSGAPFLGFVGQPALNSSGTVAFAAQVRGLGRGIYVADGTTVRAVAVRDDPAPSEPGTAFTFSGLGPNPDIDDAGAVAFRGNVAFHDAILGITDKREGIFVADASGIQAIVYKGESSPDPQGRPFFKLQDPVLTNAQSVAFRAPLGLASQVSSGLFLAPFAGPMAPIALERQDLGGGVTLTGFTGKASVGAGADMTFLASRARPFTAGSPLLRPLGPAILRSTAAGLSLVVARDMPGPAGGSFRSLGAPSMSASGHVAFRGSFLPLTGGTAGMFLATETGVAPYSLVGENTPLGGQFTSFGGRAALNAHDELAFIAAVGRGRARHGIFLAAPTSLTPRALVVRLSNGRGKDRLRIAAQLQLGRVSNGVSPAKEAVSVTLADTRGVVWTANAPAGRLKRHGGVFQLDRLRRRDALRKQIRALTVAVGSHGRVTVGALSAPVDLTNAGFRTLRPPFTVTVQVGADSGNAPVACKLGKRGGRCGR